MSETRVERGWPRGVHRAAVGALFFLQGLTFASWASRIPSIQTRLGLTEAELGLVLLALPVGLLVSLPVSGWLVSRRGSAPVVVGGLWLYAGVLTRVGAAGTRGELVGWLFAFGFLGNGVNIAVNTQAVGVEALYGRSVMASFHGMWSLAGFVAAGVGAALLGRGVEPARHFLGTFLAVALVAAVGALFTLREAGRRVEGRLFVLPDGELWGLGLMAFCCMTCEGAMFDWSGVYFERVVGAEKAWVGAGYTTFMAAMAAGRFLADGLVRRLGLKRVF